MIFCPFADMSFITDGIVMIVKTKGKNKVLPALFFKLGITP
jgi:hypothetical protein